MCGRYSIIAQASEIAERFEVEVPPYYTPRFNAAPSQLLPVITSENPEGISLFYWGLSPFRAKEKAVSERIINLRSESIVEKPVYRKALATHRCLVPADGFYEWKRLGKKTIIPYRITRKDRQTFAMAGIWEEYEDEFGKGNHTFTILTTAPNTVVGEIHNRMPVILSLEGEKTWLNPLRSENELLPLMMATSSEEMEAFTISPRVNNVKNNDASLLLPAPPADQHGNLTLF